MQHEELTEGFQRFQSFPLFSLVWLLFFSATFFMFSLPVVSATYCSNPLVSFYCQDVATELCCSNSGQYDAAANDGIPNSQADCQQNYVDAAAQQQCTTLGCCYDSTYNNNLKRCDSAMTPNRCLAGDGQFNANQNCNAFLVDNIAVCQEGCCVYQGVSGQINEITSQGFCSGQSGNFNAGVTQQSQCAALSGTPPSSLVGCSDGIDNDNDGVTDYPSDAGCSNAQDTSEQQATLVCDDGIDNDNDGKKDFKQDGTGDSGCCSATSASETVCEQVACVDSQQTGGSCVCDTSGSGEVCNAGQYCCSGSCQSQACNADVCLSGQQQFCGTDTATGCWKYQTCESGSWGSCTTTSQCTPTPEICTGPAVDEDQDGKINCQDLQCYGITCGTPGNTQGCTVGTVDYGKYLDPPGAAPPSYTCCNQATTDCDQDGLKETCGSCDCGQQPVQAVINDVAFTRGKAQLTTSWTLNCGVSFSLRRCTGEECPAILDAVDGDGSAAIRAAFPEIIGNNIAVREYTDTTIQANQRYCYIVEAQYASGNTYSEPYCIADAGDTICQQLSTQQFCLDSLYAQDVGSNVRASCDAQNKVNYLQDCQDLGSGYFCVGPYPNQEAKCEYQSDCSLCGDPLGLFGYLGTIIDFSGNGVACANVPTCYYDSTATNVDAYQECAFVDSCYDYDSSYACQGQSSYSAFGAVISNNKCLRRNCQWQDLSEGGLYQGLCQEVTDAYKSCASCNVLDGNAVFGACTLEKCTQFGGNCYLDMANQCSYADALGCSSYRTASTCIPTGQNVAIDVGQTNTVLVQSNDHLGFDLCYWDTFQGVCYKDANGDSLADALEIDKTPPHTTVLSSDVLAAAEVDLLSVDLNADGTLGSGVKNTFYCLSDGGPCYPDQIAQPSGSGVKTVVLPVGTGEHTIYYFSEDNANNLEIVQTYDFTVDNRGPIIDINYVVVPDTVSFTASAVIVQLTLDEEASCTDSFDGISGQLQESFNRNFVTRYDNLKDGFYLYGVNCTDIFGNHRYAHQMLRVDADISVSDPLPAVFYDEPSATLSIKTLSDAACGYALNRKETNFNTLDRVFTKENKGSYYLHSSPFTLGQNGHYYFTVLCTIGTRLAYDEIAFVFDNTSPDTEVTGLHGQPFDFSGFYTGTSLGLYLTCVDQPRDGFGCEKTQYCLSPTTCFPATLVQEGIPLDVSSLQQAPGQRLNLCYQSFENIYQGMGDLVEPVQCTELKLDQHPPVLTLSSLVDGMSVYQSSLTVTGLVSDPDALSGEPRNTVIISVTNTNGNTTVYSNISANNQFNASVAITLGTNQTEFNTVSVYAIDRSGTPSDVQTFRIYLSMSFPEDAIQLVQPAYGVSTTQAFDFTIQTFLDATTCGYSMNNVSLDFSIPMTPIAGNQFTKRFNISSSYAEIPQYVYVKCRLVNQHVYSKTFMLMYDPTAPNIFSVLLMNGDGKLPPTVVESPLHAVINVTTDDPVRCKYGTQQQQTFNTGMQKFPGFDEGVFSRNNRLIVDNLTDLGTYTYYAQCQNGAFMTTGIYPFSFNTDLSAAPDILLDVPLKTSLSSFGIRIRTTKVATACFYGTSEALIASPMSLLDDHHFQTTPITFMEGVHRYYFSCNFAEGTSTNYYDLVVDTTPPIIHTISDGDIESSNTTLSAKWNVSDSLSTVVAYRFAVGTSPGYNDTYPWSNGTLSYASLQGLNLQNNSKYYWSLSATNEVGLTSVVSYSDGVMILTGYAGSSCSGLDCTSEDTCNNNLKDNNETAEDCGGGCDPCLAGEVCKVAEDCISASCINNICAVATCSDIILNQDETDIDCGGGVCVACSLGETCFLNADCVTTYCSRGVCEQPSCDDNVQNGAELGVDCGGNCGECVDVVVGSGTPSCSDGLKNQGEIDIDCGGLNCSPCRKKGFGFVFWLSLSLLFIILCVGGYLLYNRYKLKGLSGLNMPMDLSRMSSLPGRLQQGMQQFVKSNVQRLQQLQPRRHVLPSLEQKKERASLFGKFEEHAKQPDEELKPLQEKKSSKDIEGSLHLQERKISPTKQHGQKEHGITDESPALAALATMTGRGKGTKKKTNMHIKKSALDDLSTLIERSKKKKRL